MKNISHFYIGATVVLSSQAPEDGDFSAYELADSSTSSDMAARASGSSDLILLAM